MKPSALTDRERAALKVVDLAKAVALADNHFLSAAVGRLKVETGAFAQPFATDGASLGVNANLLCTQFVTEREAPKHDLMHSVLHCVFLHPYVAPSIGARLWSLACDIAVERNVAQVCGNRSGERGKREAAAISLIEEDLGGTVTAEKVYHALGTGKWSDFVEEWEALFLADDHAPWYMWESPEGIAAEGEPGRTPLGAGNDGAPASPRRGGSEVHSDEARGEGGRPVEPGVDAGRSEPSPGEGPGQGSGAGPSRKEVHSTRAGIGLREVARADRSAEKEGWRRVARALAVNLQTYSRGRGKTLSGMVGELEETAHQRVDYADFLRQFAVPGEVLRVSDDEFDYVFYTYGLKLYGNLPLVEPLEYREEKRVREFVIVIDTSGSVYGEIVRRFVDSTFDILKSTEAFFERVHVRIIQCDAAVQSDDVITSLEELKEWGRTMRVHGCGGTDFRPAFAYVDKLVEDGEFENLGGLVYFTDGWGEYPEWMPEYKVAFVFYDESYRPEIVPPWAAQIVLDENAVSAA